MHGVFLYSRVMPYTISGIKTLINSFNIKIDLVHYKITSKAPYQLPPINNLTYYEENLLSPNDLIELINQGKPKFIFVTGWSNKKYLQIAKHFKKKGIPIISGCDTQWRGDFRQIMAVCFSKFLIRKYFTHIMVAGVYQYEYARLLGYKRNNVLQPLYTANIDLFSKVYKNSLLAKTNAYPKNILFVGRLEKVKGIELLIKSFKQVKDKQGWTLTIVGNGTLKDKLTMLAKGEDIIFKDFMQPMELKEEIYNAGLFCLPSIYEPWGVVIQEFAAAGLPLLTSKACGANSLFLKDGYNGYTFKNGDLKSLTDKLERLISLNAKTLLEFSKNSNTISGSINNNTYASNFAQFLLE